MSKEAVQAVIGKAVTESEFRELLFANPDEALEGFDLTEDDVAALKAIDAETMESFAGDLDERISRVLVPGLGYGDSGLGAEQVAPPTRLGGPLE